MGGGGGGEGEVGYVRVSSSRGGLLTTRPRKRWLGMTRVESRASPSSKQEQLVSTGGPFTQP